MELCHYAEDLKQQPTLVVILGLIGLLSLSKFTFSLLRWVYVTFLRPPKNLIKSYGSWALVTGAASGIGEAFAVELARKGLHLILVDRLGSHSGRIWVNPSEDRHCRLLNRVRRRTGTSNLYGKYVHEMGEEEVERMLSVNVKGTTLVTRVVLEGMWRRGRGAIVNVGSGSVSVTPSFPLYSVYAATKA
ncbi:Very-long-chain 3-oxoacyl-CoA reductase 1 [Acorus calamus]|uniref:Very-long-chain 3-oxoacyl-CoA reductase 1 n=1 Tax=Acorus calamus TaxID=4465 RepID=A0AAV9EYY9_ACOCL|nr:Very-long-chain 3-oxoacyl-CoA reductase 1 [Acorus calamus]